LASIWKKSNRNLIEKVAEMLEILGQNVGRALGRELTLIWTEIWQTLRRTLLTFGRQKFNIKGCINFVNTWAELWPIFLQNFG
jgi:hypothetical protein